MKNEGSTIVHLANSSLPKKEMMKINLVLILLLCTVSINSQQRQSIQFWNDHINGHLSRGVEKFAVALNQAIDANRIKDDNKNVVFSPLNVVELLAVMLLGSEGKSNETFCSLGFDKDKVISKDSEFLHHMFGNLINSIQLVSKENRGETPELVSANRIFVQNGYSIRPNYAAFVRDVYNYDITQVDFHVPSITKDINNWIKSASRGKINNFLQEPPSDLTEIFIASTLHFKGQWKYPRIRMTDYNDNPRLGADIVGLPYKINNVNGSMSEVTMFIVLPHQDVPLSDILSSFTKRDINLYLSYMIPFYDVTVELPKMKLSSTLNLRDTLQSLGFTSMFIPKVANLGLMSTGQSQSFKDELLNVSKIRTENFNNEEDRSIPANFQQYVKTKNFPSYGLDELRESRNFDNPGLYVSRADHKVEIDITERSTEAAAVSYVIINYLSLQWVPIKFKCNRPFLLFIRHKPSGLISFWGVVRKPTPYYK
ncbi:Similar to Spn28Dc: Serine protease inhibitor 28Dc (Drosophila melanogaster) [Cotesia congregata]|uniref:Similar to Spn28Dc: Serine protease inhibitor 28Dc (Drosophila melanogaster) n=1 Tax=Cotesia congregata TaxID=51543 RepID=A0A8J2MJD6_COTCN|nr:Similar to Spn28Dc: Serine protease inhibitor 28Dc (Drosophila melanogaster) [Cotesia congregata]